MAQAKKLPSGNWRCRAYYTDDTGKSCSISFTAATKKEAEFQAASYLIDHKRKRNPENVTVGEAIDKYIENRHAVLSPSTIKAYRSIRQFAFPSIIDTRLGYLSNEDIQVAINEYAGKHKSKSVANAHALLSAALKGKTTRIDWNIKLPQPQKQRVEIPTTKEINSIIEASKGSDLYLPILFAALLGMRRSEICALTWNDIDMKSNTIRISKALVRDENNIWVEKPPKTLNSDRALLLPSIIINALPPRNEKLIKLSPSKISDSFTRLTKKLGLPYTRFHLLRHYNTSVMLQLNIPDKYAMERTGHATNNMLKTVYQHTFSSEQELIADRMDKYFNEMLKGG